MTERVMPSGEYDARFFRTQGFYDGYIVGKRKPRHSVGSWQYYQYEGGYGEGEAKRLAEDKREQVRKVG